MKRRGVTILFVICVILTTGFVFSAAIDEELHLNIQVINSSGDVETGTFDFEFNISTLEDCSGVVYTNFTNLTTDSRGIISYYLEDVNLSFSSQYWLCYYRDGVLINASKIARTPYSFTAKNISAEGILNDSNVNLVGYNVTASSGLFSWLGSLLNRITTLFVQDIDFTGNIIGTGDVNITGVMNASDYYTYDSHVGTIRLTEIGHDVTLALDDAMIHRTNLSITASAGVVTATIYNQDEVGGNIDYVVNKTRYSIADASTVTLVAGTWVSPQTNYLWVDDSQALESSTTSPTGEYAWAGIVEVANVSGSVVEYYARQDEVPTIYEVIKNNYERAWYDNVLYESGIAITFTGEELATTSGNLRFALTSIPFVARNTLTTTKFIWMNNPDGAYSIHNDLDSITKYQDGGTIGVNKYFSVVVFGLVEDDHQDNYYITVQDEPGTEYRSVSSAEADTDSKVNYNFPSGYERTGFRIARVVLKRGVGDNDIQTLSNGLNYIQLLDETQIVLGGTSAIALGLDDVVDNNPNTDSNIISTANVTADWFFGSQFNATGTSYFQDVDFNEGWLNGGVSITDGDLYAQTVWVYNLSSLNVGTLNINGSLLPPVGFDNTFDIGNASLRWRDIYISGNLHSNGTGDNYFLGDVGIGAGSPGSKLTLWAGDFNVSNTGNGSLFYVQNSSGNVGIGTGSPEAKLDISSTDGTYLLNLNSTTDVNGGSAITFYKARDGMTSVADDDVIGNIRSTAYNGSEYVSFSNIQNRIDDFSNGIMNTSWRFNLVHNNAQIAVMRLTSSGNVGIGTSSPDFLLDLHADVGATSVARIWNTDTGDGRSTMRFRNDLTSSQVWDVGIDPGGGTSKNFQFRDLTTGGAPIVMTLEAGGDVGIGTTSPDYSLEVDGSGMIGYNLWGKESVSVNSTVFATLTHVNGSTLNSNYHYRISLAVGGTGTDTGAQYLVWYDADTTAWNVRNVSRMGSTSNHPEIFLDSGTPKIKTSHASLYTVNVIKEAIYSGNSNSMPAVWGASYMWQRDVDDLFYTDGNVGIGTVSPTHKLNVVGNVNITGNITMGDAFMFTDGSGNMIFRI